MLARIRAETQAHIQVLPGADESRLTFLAARRWFGWSSGKVLMIDIGGGSLEIASGVNEEPDVAISLPLGAGRLTRDWLTDDPPPTAQVRQLRRHVRAEIARRAGEVMRDGRPDRAVATSKTFRQLARIAGAAPSSEGFYVRRVVSHADVTGLAERLATMTAAAARGPARACPMAARRSSWQARSSPMPRWTCSAWPNWRSAPGRCVRA